MWCVVEGGEDQRTCVYAARKHHTRIHVNSESSQIDSRNCLLPSHAGWYLPKMTGPSLVIHTYLLGPYDDWDNLIIILDINYRHT